MNMLRLGKPKSGKLANLDDGGADVVLHEAWLWLFLVCENCCLMNYRDGFWLWVMDDLWLILGEILAIFC